MDIPFRVVSNSLSKIQNTKKLDDKLSILADIFQKWKDMVGNLFPLVRLILPALDRDRSSIGLKELKLATIYIKVLGLDKNSHDAKALINWKDPLKQKSMFYNGVGDFLERLKITLQSRLHENIVDELTVNQLNDQLDILVNSSKDAEYENVIRYIYTHCTLRQQIWIARIILKDMDLHMTERTVLPLIHPNAYKYFQVCADIKLVCDADLDNMEEFPITIFRPFAPQLSKRSHPKDVIEFMDGQPFWIETKLDGERMQMHLKDQVFEWWSRNATNYTHLYGGTADEGSLVPHILNAFKKGVTSIVLDGEMLVFNALTQSYEPFGTLKTAAKNDGNESEPHKHPSYVVFDVLSINGKSLGQLPLVKRFEYLKRSIAVESEYIKVLNHETASTEAELMDQLQKSMLNQEEGIIVKNPSSFYVPNEKMHWMKIKPEYIGSLSDDLDLVIIGGYYGKHRKGAGKLSGFLCGVRDTSVDPCRYISLCKFGSGYSWSNLDSVSLESQGNWKKYNPANPPSWFSHPNNKDNPDMIIEPSLSQVVQVRGTEIVPSEIFAAGYTLRFPRMICVRPDKSISQAMDINELETYRTQHEGKMQRVIDTNFIDESVKLTPSKKNKARQLNIFSQTDTASLSNVKKFTDLFKGLEFSTFLPKRAMSDTSDVCQDEIQKVIIQHGGEISIIPRARTNIVIADQITTRIDNLIKGGRFDILKPSYVIDCAREKRLVPIQPSHVIFATENTKELMLTYVDQYGDSFTDPVDEAMLKKLFEGILLSTITFPIWVEGPALDFHLARKKTISDIHERYFTDTSALLSVFERCVFYLDMTPRIQLSDSYNHILSETDEWEFGTKTPEISSEARLLICDIRAHGGTVVRTLNNMTTHIVLLNSERREVFLRVQTKIPGKLRRVLKTDWVYESIKLNCLANEDMF
ncbi:hypothetical protein BC833DRAFT_583557 [Globomyces pollinis-pini]|nr:hypothetical protein BC833DRAFT_583557 [Globomyces pollinis-pini]